MEDGTVWIETRQPLNFPEPPEGLPKGYTGVGHRCKVPTFVAKRLIEAGEAIEVDGPHAPMEPVAETETEDEAG
jgi:hypothetical protein